MTTRMLLLTALLLSSCSYRLDKKANDDGKLSGSLFYSQVNSQIFAPRCSKCHGNEWVGNYEATHALLSQISARIQSTQAGFMMPPASEAPLSEEEKAAVLSWIERGGPRDPGDVTPPEPPVARLSFANVSTKVIKPRCIRCHDPEFVTYESMQPFFRDMEFRIQAIGEDEQMPPARATQLSEEEKALLLEWLQAGAPKD